MAKKVKLKLIYEGDAHEFTTDNNRTILELGEGEGIDLPFSCRAGICTSCQAKVIKGEVDMENNVTLSEEELKDGIVLTCISKPLSDDVEIDFDKV